jgi:hypothetical protein
MKLEIKNFGPIGEASIQFGNLTFFIGPQASGKSLALELMKLYVDKGHIISTLRNYNFVLSKSEAKNVLDWYFGEGLSSLFKADTTIKFDDQTFSSKDLLSVIKNQRANSIQKESVFYVPAQRILSISDGRPKNFTEFDTDAPYVLRRFSETLRIFLQGGLGNPNTIFPMGSRLKNDVRKSIDDSIFHSGKVVLDHNNTQRKMKLEVDGVRIPFMAWSAGQKEFMPLLLAIYCLSGPPTQVVNKADYKWAIIEEPEMGLHPSAILSVLLELLELIKSGYRVIVSTHSSTFLEFVWAFNTLHSLPSVKFKKAMCELFGVKNGSNTSALFADLQEKDIKTFYSGKKTNIGKSVFLDISTLDSLSEDSLVSEWGGLISFSGKASEIVCKYVNETEE